MSVSADGPVALRRIGALLLAGLLLGCGGASPTGPSTMPGPASSPSLAARLSGDWVGYARWTTCTDSAFPGQCYAGPLDRVSLSFAESGAAWTGIVTIDGLSGPVPVTGIIGADGLTVTFAGATVPPSPSSAQTTVSSLSVHVDSAVGLVAELSVSHRQSGSSGRTMMLEGVIDSASRGADPAFPAAGVSLDGAWSVETWVESCTTFAGEPCARYPRTEGFELFLTGSAEAPRALVNLPSNLVVDLTGERASDGSMAFAGSVDHPGAAFFRTEVRSLVIRPGPAGFTGEFVYRRHHAESRNSPAGVTSYSGRIVSAVRAVRSFSPGRFQGSWRGEVEVVACLSGPCDQVSNVYDMRLDLSQAGDRVSGDLQLKGFGVPLTGTATGNSVSLAGSRSVEPCYNLSLYIDLCGQEVRNADWTIDDFGRLRGELELTLRFERDGTHVLRVRLVAVVPEI